MTREEWLVSADPAAMLREVFRLRGSLPDSSGRPGHAGLSDRKLRLFAAGCYCLTPGFGEAGEGSQLRWCVLAAEALADGGPLPLWRGDSVDSGADAARIGAEILCHCVREDAAEAARLSAASPLEGRFHPGLKAAQAALLRDIAGDPFDPVTLPFRCDCGIPCGPPKKRYRCVRCGKEAAGSCPWLTDTVLSLAKAAYEERLPDGTLDPARLLVLHDALLDAGCPADCHDAEPVRVQISPKPPTGWQVLISGRRLMPGSPRRVATFRRRDAAFEAAANLYGVKDWRKSQRGGGTGSGHEKVSLPHPLLAHLRGPGPHVRGCWAVDLILGKEQAGA